MFNQLGHIVQVKNIMIKKLAKEYAYKTFFKNVGADNWPSDPEEFLNKFGPNTWCYFLKDGIKHMEPKIIYEHLNVIHLKEAIEEQTELNLLMFREE